MAGGFSFNGDWCNGTDIGTVVASSTITTFTSGTGGVQSAYTQLVASSAADADALEVFFQGASANGNNYWWDVAVGGAGSEQNIIKNVWAQFALSPRIRVPLNIPGGTRISVRACNDGGVGDTMGVGARLFQGGFHQSQGAAGVENIITTNSGTTGVSLTSGAANTKGSYTQIIASTTRDYVGFYISFGGGNPTSGLYDIAIGGAGSEQVIIPNIFITTAGSANIGGDMFWLGPYWIAVPSGTRVAARVQAVGASQTAKVMAMGIYA